MKSIRFERDSEYMGVKRDVSTALSHYIDQTCEDVRARLQEEVDFDTSKNDNTAKNVEYIMHHFDALGKDLDEDALIVYLYYRGTFTEQYHIPTSLMESVLEFLDHMDRESIATKLEERWLGAMTCIELHSRGLDDMDSW
jgi:hypothetical protein